MFVDTSRAINVNLGETDNKKALDARKKQLLKEKKKYGLGDDEEIKLSWNLFHEAANYYAKKNKFDAGIKAIDQALGALMRDKIEQVPDFDESGITKCLLLRFGFYGCLDVLN